MSVGAGIGDTLYIGFLEFGLASVARTGKFFDKYFVYRILY